MRSICACYILQFLIFHPQPFSKQSAFACSALHSIYTYTFPPHNATAAAEALVHLYAQKGHDLHACRRFLRRKDPSLHCFVWAPITACCVCHPLVLRVFHVFPRMQGGSDPFSSHCLTKTLLIGCDIRRGRSLNVPAEFFRKLSPHFSTI